MVELAKRYADRQPVSLKIIAEEQDISSQFLVQILLQLKRAGLVQSVRGSCGGYRLAQSPTDTTLLDIVSAMEGLPETSTTAATAAASALHEIWQEANSAFQACLSNITLSALTQRIPSRSGDMYYI